MKTFRFLAPAAAVWAALAGAPGAGAETLGLDQAVAEALAHGADLQVLNANLDASRGSAALTRARAGVALTATGKYTGAETVATLADLPDGDVTHTAVGGLTLGSPWTTVSVSGTQNLKTVSGTTTNPSQTGSLAVSQTLWNGYPGGAVQAAADKARLTLQGAELTAAANKNKLVFTLKQAYFTLLSAQETLAQLTLAQAQRLDTLKFVQTKFSLGQATALDLKQAQINARSAALDLTAGQGALATAQRRLANLLGRDPALPLTVAPAEDPQPAAASAAEAVALALDHRVELRTAQNTAAAADIDGLAAFGASTPTVTLGATADYTRYLLDAGAGASAVHAGDTALKAALTVNLSQPLVDAGAAAAQAQVARAQKTAAQAQYRQLQASIPVDVAEAWTNWQVALDRYAVAQASADLAQSQLEVVQAQFDAGLKSITDLQTGQLNLSTAQLALLKAKITAQQLALTLQSLMGL